MRVRPRQHRVNLPATFLLALSALLATPLVALAQSGLPSTVTLHPASAAPGSVVEVTGIDFPAGEPVVLELVSGAGTTDLAVVMAAEGGYFRELVTLPADVAPGAWELRASGLDGATASHAFDVTGDPAGDQAGTRAATSEASLTSSRGNSGTDVMVMIIIGVMLGAIGTAAAYAWREVHAVAIQPGMAAGDDPIWGGSVEDLAPELTASGEPAWNRPKQDA